MIIICVGEALLEYHLQEACVYFMFQGTRHNKMEKADILEMTVKHLRQIQRQQFAGKFIIIFILHDMTYPINCWCMVMKRLDIMLIIRAGDIVQSGWLFTEMTA